MKQQSLENQRTHQQVYIKILISLAASSATYDGLGWQILFITVLQVAIKVSWETPLTCVLEIA